MCRISGGTRAVGSPITICITLHSWSTRGPIRCPQRVVAKGRGRGAPSPREPPAFVRRLSDYRLQTTGSRHSARSPCPVAFRALVPVPAPGSKGGCASFSIKLPSVRPVAPARICFDRLQLPRSAASRRRATSPKKEPSGVGQDCGVVRERRRGFDDLLRVFRAEVPPVGQKHRFCV